MKEVVWPNQFGWGPPFKTAKSPPEKVPGSKVGVLRAAHDAGHNQQPFMIKNCLGRLFPILENAWGDRGDHPVVSPLICENTAREPSGFSPLLEIFNALRSWPITCLWDIGGQECGPLGGPGCAD